MNSTASSASSLIGRLLLATLFLVSGIGKLAAPAATKAYILSAGLPFPDLAYGLAVLVEVGFALALVVGYRTKGVAAVMAAFALVTAFAFHAHFGDQNQFIHFLKNLAITGGLLQVVAQGAGALSIDGYRNRMLSARL
jgi:putative oxidoreductase